MIAVDDVIEIAKATAIGNIDDFDWDGMPLTKDETYRLVATGLTQMELTYDAMLATCIKLSVENMLLHMKGEKNG